MIETFVKRPATTVMMILFFVILGIVAYFDINTELYPRIDFPLVSIDIVYPGASPLEIESEAIRRIEDEVVEVAGIKQIESQAFENAGFIIVEFELSEDINVKTAEVKDKVEGVLNDLPEDMERPIVQRLDPFATPVVSLVLSSDSHSSTELYEFSDKNLIQQLSRIEGAGSIDIIGGQERKIKIDLAPDLMRKNFISILDVVQELRTKNLTVPGGNIERDKTTLAVRFMGEFSSIDEIKNMDLTNRDGDRFKLSEIAHIYDGSDKIDSMARFEGENIVAISINKVSDGNDVVVSEGVQSVLPDVKEILEEGMSIEIAVDQSEFVVRETNETFLGIFIGILLTVGVLFFFTGKPAITIIASIVIPSSLISSVFLMEGAGFTINFMTLLAMATSLGTLIANAIVIVESVVVHLDRGKSPEQSAIDGTKNVVVPILAAGGTNLVVFTPIAFMGGIVGQFMSQFGFTVVFATIFSLIASFSLTPMMCALLLKNKTHDKPNLMMRASQGFISWLLKEYKIIFEMMFRFPKISIIFAVALVFGGFSVLPYVGNEFIPASDEDRIEVQLTLPQGSNIWKTLEVVKEVERELEQYPQVESVFANLGENGQENATVIANLLPSSQRQVSDIELIEYMTPAMADLVGVEVELIRGEGGEGSADVTIHVQGINYDKMIETSYEYINIMQESGLFRSVTSSYKTPGTEINFYPDSQKIERYGLSNSEVGQALRASIFGDDSNIYKESGEEYDIVVELGEDYKRVIDSIDHIFLTSRLGLVSVSELGEIRLERAIPNIRRRDRQRVIQLEAYLNQVTAGEAQAILAQKFNEVEVPRGHGYAFVGDAENQEESQQEISKAFGLAVVLTYMILAAIMNSFIHPFTISTTIFSSFSGVFVMLFFMQSSINLPSMLAIVMLVGLAVNNAILILEQTEENIRIEPDIDIIEALWLGIQQKFRAVLMTSIAIICGTAPQIFSSSQGKSSMGSVIVGGMIASIIFTFILTPQIYWYFERLRRWFRKLVTNF